MIASHAASSSCRGCSSTSTTRFGLVLLQAFYQVPGGALAATAGSWWTSVQQAHQPWGLLLGCARDVYHFVYALADGQGCLQKVLRRELGQTHFFRVRHFVVVSGCQCLRGMEGCVRGDRERTISFGVSEKRIRVAPESATGSKRAGRRSRTSTQSFEGKGASFSLIAAMSKSSGAVSCSRARCCVPPIRTQVKRPIQPAQTYATRISASNRLRPYRPQWSPRPGNLPLTVSAPTGPGSASGSNAA